MSESVSLLVWQVRTLAPGRASYPSSTCVADGILDGRPVLILCDWRSAWLLQDAITEAGGGPIVADAPCWSIVSVTTDSPEMPAPGYDAGSRPVA